MKQFIIILIGLLIIPIASAHTYDINKNYKDSLEWVDEGTKTLKWGDRVEVGNYTIEATDFEFHEGDLRKKPEVYLRIFEKVNNETKVILNNAFSTSDMISSGDEVSYVNEAWGNPKAGEWDKGTWNYNNDFKIMVSKIGAKINNPEELGCIEKFPRKPIDNSEYAEIKYAFRGKPEFETSITTLYKEEGEEVESDEFESDSIIISKIEIKNTGDARFYHVKVDLGTNSIIDTDALQNISISKKLPPDHLSIKDFYDVIGDDKKRVDNKLPKNPRSNKDEDTLEAGDSHKYEVHFKAPSVPIETHYEIHVTVTGEDLKETPYEQEINKTILIHPPPPPIVLRKAIGTQEYIESGDESEVEGFGAITYEVYRDYSPFTFINIKNRGKYPINSIILTDNTTSEWFELPNTDFEKLISPLPSSYWMPPISTNPLIWNFNLSAGEDRTISYPISLLKPGTYKLSSAVANWSQDGEYYNVTSPEQEVNIHGPYITVSKTINPNPVIVNENATITLKIKNTGDRTASVNITDNLPPDSSLIYLEKPEYDIINQTNTSINMIKILQPGAETALNYIISFNNTGNFTIPPTLVKYTDIRLYKGTNLPEIQTVSVITQAEAEKLASESAGSSSSDSSKDNSAVSVPTKSKKKQPGFELGLLLFILIIIFLYKKKCRVQYVSSSSTSFILNAP